MIDIDELKAQHGALRAVGRHLLDVAAVERGFRAAAPGLLRDLDDMIVAHSAAEAGMCLDDAACTAEPIAALHVSWSAYLATWTSSRIAGDWAGFAAATRAMVPRMLARIDHEEQCLDRMARTG